MSRRWLLGRVRVSADGKAVWGRLGLLPLSRRLSGGGQVKSGRGPHGLRPHRFYSSSSARPAGTWGRGRGSTHIARRSTNRREGRAAGQPAMTRDTKTGLVALAFVAGIVGVFALLAWAGSYLPAPHAPAATRPAR